MEFENLAGLWKATRKKSVHVKQVEDGRWEAVFFGVLKAGVWVVRRCGVEPELETEPESELENERRRKQMRRERAMRIRKKAMEAIGL